MSESISRNRDKPLYDTTTLNAYIEAGELGYRITAGDEGLGARCVADSRAAGFKIGTVKWPGSERRCTYKVSLITAVLRAIGLDHKAPTLKQCRAVMKKQKKEALT